MNDGYQAPGSPFGSPSDSTSGRPMSGPMSGATPTSDDKTLAIITHLLCLVTAFVGPLVVYLIKQDSPFVRHHAAEALNFQISIFIYMVVSVLLAFIFIGIPLLFALPIFNLVMIIIAAIKASEGVSYRYPLCLRFIS